MRRFYLPLAGVCFTVCPGTASLPSRLCLFCRLSPRAAARSFRAVCRLPEGVLTVSLPDDAAPFFPPIRPAPVGASDGIGRFLPALCPVPARLRSARPGPARLPTGDLPSSVLFFMKYGAPPLFRQTMRQSMRYTVGRTSADRLFVLRKEREKGFLRRPAGCFSCRMPPGCRQTDKEAIV